ncbi:MAG TPA: hypothetical protein VG895_01605 [Patescibacteria group bacterium]|nr:hypothetical protein [Patescibacteria group bacterium]
MAESVVYNLKLPRNTEITPDAALTFLSSILSTKSPISLIIFLASKQINFKIVCHKSQSDFVESSLFSAYPTITVEKLNIRSLCSLRKI